MALDETSIFGDHTDASRFTDPHVVDGEVKSKGLIPRDYSVHPVGYHPLIRAVNFPMIPESEYADRIAAMEGSKSRTSDIRMRGNKGGMIPSLDQNGKGYCLVAGTPVLMADGSKKAVETIQTGDEVITHLGRARKVLHPTSRKFSGNLLRVCPRHPSREDQSVTATECHPFLTLDGTWKPLGELGPRGKVFYNGFITELNDYQESRPVTDYPVYCLNVDEDHSFIANGFTVHNCWAHSTTMACMLVRAIMNQPYVPLSAYAVACVIKDFADEGGWGALSTEFAITRGIPSQEKWPQQSMSRSHDNAETWKDAAKYKISGGFWDLQAAVYDRNLTLAQTLTLLLSTTPVVGDFNWWGHSICLMDAVNGRSQFGTFRLSNGKKPSKKAFDLIWGMNSVTGGIGIRFINSWGDSYEDNGMSILTGSKAVPDGAVAPAIMLAA